MKEIKKTCIGIATLLTFGVGQNALAATVVNSAPAPGSDLDGDGIAYSMDNAEWVFNPEQYDGDGDGLADVIDPDDGDWLIPQPTDINLNVGGTYYIAPGDTLNINLSVNPWPGVGEPNQVPMEQFAYVGFQLDGVSSLDAFLLPFDPIATISADYLVTAGWDLNTSGTYNFTAYLNNNVGTWGTATGTVVVSAVPVPAAVWLFGSGLIGLIGFAKRKRK